LPSKRGDARDRECSTYKEVATYPTSLARSTGWLTDNSSVSPSRFSKPERPPLLEEDSYLLPTVRIDRSVAAETGAWYLSSANLASDPQVVAAYDRLQQETDRFFSMLVDDRNVHAVRIAFTRGLEPYGDDRELIQAIHADRLLEVTTAAVNSGRMHPVLGCGFGGAFDRFRAVHDVIGHGWFGFGFELDDEYGAWQVQDRLYRGIARRALATELCGVNCARWTIGQAPEQRAMLVPCELLDDLVSTIAGRDDRDSWEDDVVVNGSRRS
jgi:hypothetical protein